MNIDIFQGNNNLEVFILYNFVFLLGCYYNGMRYTEGEQIVTNEPCLNCTCHNQMLMCFLKVCPFIKPVGKHCVVEKKPDQCCPTINCPQGMTYTQIK